MYNIDFLPPAEKYFKKLKDKNLKRKFQEAIMKIRENPYIGEAKRGDLAGIYGYDVYYNRTNYEIAYTITEVNGNIIIVIMAGTRENFWNTIKKYINS
ncbi:type II toxin-antitoxin system RelE/ParE family toxin [Thermotalea metallivorans]|uniref:Plasmid stabilization system protein n=1 Tax=Thermotalea metallivorans TaxID=520762 RepID=A0A140L850_9FIRM|nr:type II toxin-antitoxin system RelE/ParE family toxin [Thermotalea metallivorans]KXG76725.1 hypothetical protein AN619_08750 [Thermotalea metallivorans]